MIIKKFTSHSNDLFCDVGKCRCPSPTFIGSDIEHLMKKRIKLTGYWDKNFFENVNKEKRKYECGGCNMKFDYQWKTDGVYISNNTMKIVQ